MAATDTDTGRLAAVKLRAVAPTLRLNTSKIEERDFPYGAGLMQGSRGALYLVRDHIRTIDLTLLWMQKHQLEEIGLVIEGDGGIPARRAIALTCEICGWQMQGGSLERAQPAPHLPSIEVPQSHELFAATIQGCGAPHRPLGKLAGERLLWHRVINGPALINASSVGCIQMMDHCGVSAGRVIGTGNAT